MFSWDIGPTWQLEADPDLTSEVEVRFVSEGAERTRVELEHRPIDRHGPGWVDVGTASTVAGMAALPHPLRGPVRAGSRRGRHRCRRRGVDRPASDVFVYATDPARFDEWQKGVVDGHMDEPGSRRSVPCAGRRTAYRQGRAVLDVAVGHIDAPRTCEVHGIDGPIRAIVDVTVEGLGPTRSRLTIVVDFEGHGIGRLLVPLLVRREAEKDMPTNVAALKDRMEAVHE